MWFSSLFHKFYPLEQGILDYLVERSTDTIKPLLLAQIKEVNLVQRHADSKEINFYTMKGGRVFKNPSIRMPIDVEEYKYATLTAQIDNELFRVDTWVVNGSLFSLTFNRSPKMYMKRTDIILLDVKVNYPVLMPDKQPIKTLSCHESPFTKIPLDFYLNQLETKLPEDYLSIASNCIDIDNKDWQVLGIDKVKHVILQNDNYYVLAESNGDKYLMIKDRGQDGILFFATHDSDDIIDMGNNLLAALKKLK